MGEETQKYAEKTWNEQFKEWAKAKEAGMTNEEIKEEFRMDSPQQLGGFARTYALRKRMMEEKNNG